MYMKFINLTKINEEFNELALAKFDLENIWKTKNIPLYDFIGKHLSSNMNNFVYWGDEIITFIYAKGYNDKYVFYYGNSNEKINEYFIDIVSTLLVKSNFNIKGVLKEVSTENLALAEKHAPDYPYFLIDNTYYVFKE